MKLTIIGGGIAYALITNKSTA